MRILDNGFFKQLVVTAGDEMLFFFLRFICYLYEFCHIVASFRTIDVEIEDFRVQNFGNTFSTCVGCSLMIQKHWPVVHAAETWHLVGNETRQRVMSFFCQAERILNPSFMYIDLLPNRPRA